MAITWVSSSNTTYASRTNTTVTAPASIADNDVMIAYIITAAASEAPNPTAPAGWTEIDAAIDVSDTSAFNLEARTYIKVASGESGDYTWTHSSASSQGAIAVFRGVDTTTPQDATSTAANQQSSTRTWTGLTTATNAAWLVAFGSDWADFSAALTPPTGMTERIEVNPLIYLATEEIATAGATGNRSHTSNTQTGGASGRNTARLIALRPSSGAAADPFFAHAPARTVTRKRVSEAYRPSGLRIRRQNFAIDPTLARPERQDTAAKTWPRSRRFRPARRDRIDITSNLALTETVGGTNYTLDAEAGSYATTGADADLELGRVVVADSGSYAVNGTDASLEFGFRIAADAGSYSVAGSDADLELGREVVADAGAYSVTGSDVNLVALADKAIAADAGAYAVTGADTSLEYGFRIAADAGAYTVTGTIADLELGREVVADAGSYATTGASVDLEYGREVVADAGAYGVTGSDVTLTAGSAKTIAADAGSYAVTGADVALEYGFRIAADGGSYAVTGADVTLARGTSLVIDGGSYAVAGSDVGFVLTYALAADSGSYAVNGSDVALAYSEDTPAPPEPRRLAGGGTIRRSRSVRARYVGEEDEEDEKQPDVGPVEFEPAKIPAPVKAPSPEAVEAVAEVLRPKPTKPTKPTKPADPINRAVAADDDDFLQFAMIVWANT
jgi:hypothetical protein